MTFKTNKGREIEVGSSVGGTPFSFESLGDAERPAVIGFTLISDEHLLELSVYFVDLDSFSRSQFNTFIGVPEKRWIDEMEVSKKMGGIFKGPIEFDSISDVPG